MSVPVLIDTNILIDYLSSCAQARIEIDRHSDRAISVITLIEVMAGSTASDEDQTREFLLNFETLPLTAQVADLAFQIRRNRKIKLPDAVIQATAGLAGRILVTRNTRNFPPGAPGVRIPYTI